MDIDELKKAIQVNYFKSDFLKEITQV